MNKVLTAVYALFAAAALMLTCSGAHGAGVIMTRTISTEEELAELCGKTVRDNIILTPGIYDMSRYNWKPIQKLEGPCTIDGRGAVIEGICLDTVVNREQSGFAGNNYGTIKNLSVRTCGTFCIPAYAGGIAAVNYGQIENCTVSG